MRKGTRIFPYHRNTEIWGTEVEVEPIAVKNWKVSLSVCVKDLFVIMKDDDYIFPTKKLAEKFGRTLARALNIPLYIYNRNGKSRVVRPWARY